MSGDKGGASAPPNIAERINKSVEMLADIIGDFDSGDVIEVEVETLKQIEWMLLGTLGMLDTDRPPATVHTLRVIPGYADDEGGDAS